MDFELNDFEQENHNLSLLNNHIEIIQEEMNRKKRLFIEAMLRRKGYAHLLPLKQCRFSKINRSVGADGWEYIFADNDTVQGHFIVAISPIMPEKNSGNPKRTGLLEWRTDFRYNFKWQDQDFSAVRIRE